MKNKTKLTHENYEVIFFKMIEGEYSAKEYRQIEREIAADTFYSFEWKKWQQTKIDSDTEKYALGNVAFFDHLKNDIALVEEKPRRKVFVLLPYLIGAAATILIALFLFIQNKEEGRNALVLEKEAELNNTGVKENVDALEQPADLFDNTKSLEFATEIDEQSVKSEREDIEKNDILKESKDTKWAEQEIVNDSEPQKNISSDSSLRLAQENDLDAQIRNFAIDSLESQSENAVVMQDAPRRQFKFTVTEEKVKRKSYYTIQDLKAQGIGFGQLMADKRATLVRENSKLYLRLEKDESEVYYVSLD